MTAVVLRVAHIETQANTAFNINMYRSEQYCARFHCLSVLFIVL